MDWSGFVSDALQLVLAAVLPFLVGYGVKYLKALAEAKLAEIDPSRDWNYDLSRIAEIAVKAAEQLGVTQAIEDKKKYAVDLVDKSLQERGYTLDFDLIEAAIEAAVLDNFNSTPKHK